jgi:hypothetical protein
LDVSYSGSPQGFGADAIRSTPLPSLASCDDGSHLIGKVFGKSGLVGS